jgi:hypothetical protein
MFWRGFFKTPREGNMPWLAIFGTTIDWSDFALET